MTVQPARLASLEGITLKTGSHDRVEDGLCVMEAVAYVAGEAHSDEPECASRTLIAFGIGLNDTLPAARRQELVPLIPQIVADSAARSAARSAAENLFAPTVADLQTSAIALFAAMIRPVVTA